MEDRNEWLRSIQMELYVEMEERQRNAFWKLTIAFGIALFLMTREEMHLLGAEVNRDLVFSVAPFFVFVMAGRFYFLSAYVFEAFVQVFITSLGKLEHLTAENAWKIYRSLTIRDISFGLNPFFESLEQPDTSSKTTWRVARRIGSLCTPIFSIGVPFLGHALFTLWFALHGSNLKLPSELVRFGLVMYISFLAAGSFMVAHLFVDTSSKRRELRELLASPTE